MDNKEPYYWANAESKQFLERGYLKPGQSVQERVRIIAENAERISGITGFADKFEDYMSRGWYSLSSPVWSNYGTDRGLPVSCFGSYFDDSMESILYTLSEVGTLSKSGGGTSGYIGEIRPRGSDIRDTGKSTGAVHFMEMFDKMTDVVSQGSVRRGFFSPYMNIDHGDFDEFVEIGSDEHPIQTLTHGVTVSDKFLEDMIAGNEENRRRWAKVLKNRSEVGYPYIFFEDNVNNNSPKVYRDKGIKIHASNMCVTGETIIKVKYQDKEFEETIESFNEKYNSGFYSDIVYTLSKNLDTGEDEWKEVEASAQTDIVEELYVIEDDYGNVLECTGNHQIYTKNRGYVRADELTEEDMLASFS